MKRYTIIKIGGEKRFSNITLEEAFNLFKEDILNLRDSYRNVDSERHLSFSYRNDLCPKRTDNYDPFRDAYIIEGDLYDLGWKGEVLDDIFETYTNDIISDRNLSVGAFDVFFYQKTKGKYPLSGYYFDHNDDPYEILIKYEYGWHKTKYGKLILKQAGIELIEFRELSAKAFINRGLDSNYTGLVEWLEYEIRANIGEVLQNIVSDKKGRDYFENIAKFSIKNCIQNGVTVVVPYENIVEILNTRLHVEIGAREKTISTANFVVYLREQGENIKIVLDSDGYQKAIIEF